MWNKLKAISKVSVALALLGAAVPAVEAAPTAMAAKKATKKAKKSTKKTVKKSTKKAKKAKKTTKKKVTKKAAAKKAAVDKAAASSNSESATVDSSSSSETTNPTVDTPFAGKAVHTIYTGTNTYLYTTKELTTIATTPLQGNTSVIAYPDGITTALTGKNAGHPAIPVTYKGQNLYYKGTFEGLTSNDLYPDGYYYALGDTTFYGVVKPTDPSVKLDAPFLNGSTWFYYFDGGVTIYRYKNNVWTSNTFLNAQ